MRGIGSFTRFTVEYFLHVHGGPLAFSCLSKWAYDFEPVDCKVLIPIWGRAVLNTIPSFGAQGINSSLRDQI